MSVRAKLRCSSMTDIDYGNGKIGTTVTFYAATGPENEEWAVATPAATLTMTINNAAAADQFAVGKDYFVDLAEATA